MNDNFGAEFANQTNIHPISIIVTIICGIWILFSKRENIIWAFAIILCFFSSVQKITIIQLDFSLIRILILFGLIRFVIKPEKTKFIWHSMDKLILYYAATKTLIYTLQMSSLGAFVYQLGAFIDSIGVYFVFRNVFRSWMDIKSCIQVFILLSIPISLFFIYEYLTQHNLFSIFAGIPEKTMIRDGKLRCQGAFSHPIVAGCFWASLLPLTVASRWSKTAAFVSLAIVASFIIILTTASSTPLFAVIFAIIGGIMFYVKHQMKLIRIVIMLTLLSLHLVMKAPVWHLISRVTLSGGSTSYYRYAIIQETINHFNDWWLLGTRSTANWDMLWDNPDIPNQFVFEAVKGGLISLVLFIVIIATAFNSVGNSWRRVVLDKEKLAFSWACGVALLVHCANFIGITYFGQITTILYLQLAMIASIDTLTIDLLSNNLKSSYETSH